MGGTGSTARYKPYMSTETRSRRVEIQKQIESSLDDIGKNNKTLTTLSKSSDNTCQKLTRILKGCNNLMVKCGQKIYKKRTTGQGSNDEEERKLIQESDVEIRSYLQKELNLTCNINDEDVRCRELGDVLFYYLWKDENLDSNVQLIIQRIHEPRSDSTWCAALSHAKIFSQFYKRLGGNPGTLEYFIYKQPELLFKKQEHELRNRLREHLQYENLHQILMNTRNNQAQTCMFYLSNPRLFESMYRHRTNDFLKLQRLQDNTGCTALHVNPYLNSHLLCDAITLVNQAKLNILLTIKDNNNETAYDTPSDGFMEGKLTWLKNQFRHHNYPLYYKPRVLILYSVNHRPEAKEEAKTIYGAFAEIADEIEIRKMGTKKQIIQAIGQTAVKRKTSVLIVCVMSHGSIGTIFDSERNPITLSEIEGVMCSDQLKERPKILIVQSCEAEQTDGGSTSSNKDPDLLAQERLNIPYVPVADHFLAIQSCVVGQKSGGCVFILNLAEQIKNCKENEHFESLVEEASYELTEEKEKEIPIHKTTLKGRICLRDYCTQKDP